MKILLILLLALGLLHSEELDDLLSEYANNSDLSEKTKLENGGTITIFTRKDIDIMQARKLKDILKSNPLKRYTESPEGTPDMLYKGGIAAFSSSSIRVYIDNHELNSATYGSGFSTIGNMSLDFVDHIEIYSNSPSFEFTSEPTFLLIKLYTKTAERDRGGKLGLSYGSYGFNEEILSYADELEDFSYFTSVFRTDNKREPQSSYGVPVKRDGERLTVLASIYNDKHRFLINAMKDKSDLSISDNVFTAYGIAKKEHDYFFVGYDTDVIDNFTILASAQYADSEVYKKDILGYYEDRNYSRKERTLTAELKYNLESQNNRLIVGAKFRHKYFETDSFYIGATLQPTKSYDKQNISSVFFEERYNISENSIINAAAHYSYTDNNSYVNDENLLQLRLAHTYLYDNFVFKTFIYHVESLIEPYIYTDTNTVEPLKPQTLDTISEEIKYRYKSSEFKLFLAYREHENVFKENVLPSLYWYTNSEDKYKNLVGYLEYTYDFNHDNKLVANVSYNYAYDMPKEKREGAAFVRSLNSVGKFDVFNEVVFNRNNIIKKNYFDYSAGVKYRHSKELTLSVKGENIFNRGYEEGYFRVNPTFPFPVDTPLLISPVEQRFYVTVEYLF